MCILTSCFVTINIPQFNLIPFSLFLDQSPTGITTAEVYSELFAAYLYQNEL